VLLGGTGYVGKVFQWRLSLLGIPYEVLTRSEVDYTRPIPLRAALRELDAEFLINAAGYTGKPNVDACELHKAECLAGNAVLPGVIRSVCEELALPWGHVSSGCIFTGSGPGGEGFREDDPPNFTFRQDNCSFYSGCKALGEEMLTGAENCFVWRLRIPFDSVDSPRNYISKVLNYDRLLDATNSLSHLLEFVTACLACWTNRVPYGTYNLTNPGHVTTREVVAMLCSHGLSDKTFSFFENETEFMRVAADTPRSNCVLDSAKAIAAGLKLTPVHDALDHAMHCWHTVR